QAEQGLDVLRRALLALQRAEELPAPRQAVAARRAPATGLAGEELLHAAQERGHVVRVIHRQRRAGTHARADLGDAAGVRRRLEVLGQQEAGTGAAGLPALEPVAVLHAAGVVLEQLAGRDA